jgi:hypothetical protein
LEAGIGKQREELSNTLQEYISLITKLLQDKNDLTNRLVERETQLKERDQELLAKH